MMELTPYFLSPGAFDELLASAAEQLSDDEFSTFEGEPKESASTPATSR